MTDVLRPTQTINTNVQKVSQKESANPIKKQKNTVYVNSHNSEIIVLAWHEIKHPEWMIYAWSGYKFNIKLACNDVISTKLDKINMCSSDGQKGQKSVQECCKIIYMYPIATFKSKGEFSTHQARSMLSC